MSGPSKEPGFNRDSVEFARVLAFSDGLFAIVAKRWKPEGADELLRA
jgi:hypothetical protein